MPQRDVTEHVLHFIHTHKFGRGGAKLEANTVVKEDILRADMEAKVVPVATVDLVVVAQARHEVFANGRKGH